MQADLNMRGPAVRGPARVRAALSGRSAGATAAGCSHLLHGADVATAQGPSFAHHAVRGANCALAPDAARTGAQTRIPVVAEPAGRAEGRVRVRRGLRAADLDFHFVKPCPPGGRHRTRWPGSFEPGEPGGLGRLIALLRRVLHSAAAGAKRASHRARPRERLGGSGSVSGRAPTPRADVYSGCSGTPAPGEGAEAKGGPV